MTKNKKCKCGSDYDVDVKMSVPEGMEFNTSYIIPNETMDHTLHNKYYWDTNRNGKENHMTFTRIICEG